MTEVKITIFHTWDDGNGSSYHCGSLRGAQEFAHDKVAKGDVKAYAIEVIDWLPIDDRDPDGQLYGAMKYHCYQEV